MVRRLQCRGPALPMVSVFFVVLVLACGAAMCRVVRLPLNVAPLVGLAGIAVLTTWCATLGAPPLLSSALLVTLGLFGLASSVKSVPQMVGGLRQHRIALLILVFSAVIPGIVLGTAFA